MSLCEDDQKLKYALNQVKNISRRPEVVVEEFLRGSNHGISTIIKNGEIRFLFFDDEYYWNDNFLVGGTSYPSSLSKKNKDSFKEQIEILVKYLKVSDGIFHCQGIVSNEKKSILLKFVGELQEICTQSLLPKVRTFLMNLFPFLLLLFSVRKYHSIINMMKSKILRRESVFIQKNGHIKKINLLKIDEFIVDKYIWLTNGDFIGNFKNEKVGIAFLKCQTKAELNKVIKIVQNEELVEMTE